MSSDKPQHVEESVGDAWFQPAEQLEELRAKQKQASQPAKRPDRVPPSKITTYEDLFQPRELDEKHLNDLARALRHKDELEPLTVFPLDDELVLIDGHHRLEAYRRAKITTAVPVRHFEGTLEEAVLEAGRANSKAKLSMNARQRMNYAWRLVLMGGYSKSEIVEAASVSDGQVARMRRAKKALGDEALGYSEWWKAQKRWQGQEDDLSDEDLEERLDVLAQQNADRLANTFSSKLSNNIALTARTFSIYFGRKLPELVEELQGYVTEGDEEDLNDDF